MSDSESGSEEEQEYEVEAIIDYRSEDSDGGDCREYLVKWKGYDVEESTWEPRAQLTDPLVKEKISKFKKRRQEQRLGELADKRSHKSDSRKRKNSSGDEDYQDYQMSRNFNDFKKENKKRSDKGDSKKYSKKRKKELAMEELRKNRISKGQNAYASGSGNRKPSFIDNLPGKEKDKHRKKSSDMASKLKARPKLPKQNVESRRPISRPISGGFNELTGLQQTRVPTTSIKKKSGAEKNSYESMKKDFYKKQDAISNANVTQDSNVLDDF